MRPTRRSGVAPEPPPSLVASTSANAVPPVSSFGAMIDSVRATPQKVAMKASGPLLTPLPPKSSPRGAPSVSGSASLGGGGSAVSAPGPLLRALSLRGAAADEEKSASTAPALSRAPSKSIGGGGDSPSVARTPSKPTTARVAPSPAARALQSNAATAAAASTSAASRNDAERDAAEADAVRDDLAAGADDHLNSPRTRHAGKPRMAPVRIDPATQAALTPYTLNPALLHSSNAAAAATAGAHSGAVPAPAAAAAAAAGVAPAPSLRPWYINIQEKGSAASGRTHRRNRLLHEQMNVTRSWSRQIRDIVGQNETQFARRARHEAEELQRLQDELARKQEIEALQLEAIASICDLPTRGRAKKARQLALVQSDHARLQALEAEKASALTGVWQRRRVRQQRVQEEFCSSWEVLHFLGSKLHSQSQSMIAQSNAQAVKQLSQLRTLIPKHLGKANAMQLSLQEIGTHAHPAIAAATAAAAAREHALKPAMASVFARTPGIGLGLAGAPQDDGPSDFRFPPSTSAADAENGVSLRLPTSIAGKRGTSGIDHQTGLFDASLLVQSNSADNALAQGSSATSSHRGSISAAGAAPKASDRNFTANHESLSLIHGGLTLLHAGAPQLNPSWVTLSCEGCPRLLPRSAEQLASSPAYTLIYEELRRDLDGLMHREHVLDLLEQALANYAQVAQINVAPAMAARKAAEALSPSSYSRSMASHIGSPHGSPPPRSKLSAARFEPDSLEENERDPLVMSRKVVTRLQDLLLSLECSGFGPELDVFRASSGGVNVLSDANLPGMKSLGRMLLTAFATKSRSYGRFYMEIHSASQKNSWFAGFVLAPAPAPATAKQPSAAGVPSAEEQEPPLSVLDVDLYSTTQHTLALHCDGSTFMSGHSRRVLAPLAEATVVGFVIDILHGSITYTVDGTNPKIIFGIGAEMYTLEEQKVQQGWIGSQRLRPCFGVLGPKVKLQQASQRDGERERHRAALGLDGSSHSGLLSPSGSNPSLLSNGGEKSKRSRHALTSYSSFGVTDAQSEAAGTIFARDIVQQPAATDVLVTPAAVAEETPSDLASGSFSSSASSRRASLRSPTPTAAALASSSSPFALHQAHNDGLIGWIVPKLSVNLGEMDFLYLPKGTNMAWPTNDSFAKQTSGSQSVVTPAPPPPPPPSLPSSLLSAGRLSGYNLGVGACLAMNTPAAPLTDLSLDGVDSSLMHAFTAHQQARIKRQALAAKSRPGGGSEQVVKASDSSSATPSPPPAQSLDAAVLDYKHRQSAQAMAALDAVREGMLARPSPDVVRREAEEQQVAFAQSVTNGNALVSWSHFPPHSLRVQQAVLKVQRIARRYIGFKARRALWHKLSRYAGRIQRCWRRYRSRRNARFLAAVLPIQRVWRGHRARRMVGLLKKYNLTYAEANRAAIRIQAFTRMLLARKRVLVLAMVVQQKIEQVKGLVVFVQRMFRRRREKRAQMGSKAMLSSVLLFQARIRGIRLRRMLACVDPSAARQLRTIAASVTEKRRRWAAAMLLQRVWRGHVARRYAQMKRNVLERDAQRMRDAWRAYQLRQRIDKTFQGHDAAHLKAFFHALGYFPQLPQGTL